MFSLFKLDNDPCLSNPCGNNGLCTHAILTTDIKLIKKTFHYELNANHVHYNGDVITGDFEPVLMAIHKGDRSDAGIKKTRIVISPIGGRKGTEFP